MMTPLYDQWLSHLAHQERFGLALIGLALLIVVTVYYGRRWRIWLLWSVALVFWASLFALVVTSPPKFGGRLTGGVLIGQPLWYDETFTWSVARLPWDRMMQAVAGDVHPPAWYAIEWATVRLLGNSVVALRLPALLFSVAGLYLTYRLAVVLGYPSKTAILAVIILAAFPGWRYYGQEARMYALMACGVLLAALGLATHHPWILAIGVTAALYTHNLAVVYVAVIMAVALGSQAFIAAWRAMRGDRDQLGRGQIGTYTVATLAVVVSWLPWLAWLLSQANQVANGFWLPDQGLGGYLMGLYQITVGMGIPPFLQIHAMLAIVGLLALALWGIGRDHSWSPVLGIILAMLALTPPMLLAIASELWRPIYLTRALLPSLPFLAILMAAGLVRLAGSYRLAILAVLVPLLILCAVFQSKDGLTDVRMAADVIRHYRPGDTIYHANLASYILLSYYLPADQYTQAVWPDAGNLSQALTISTQEAMGIPRMDASRTRSERLLIVWIENPMSTQAELDHLAATLALGESRRLEHWETETTLVTVELWEVIRPVRQGESPGPR